MYITWSAVLLPVLKFLDEGLSSALVGPPVRDVRPEVGVAAGEVVLVGHDHAVARRPQVPEGQRLLKPHAASLSTTETRTRTRRLHSEPRQSDHHETSEFTAWSDVCGRRSRVFDRPGRGPS